MKRKAPLSLRLDPGIEQRLEDCAKAVKLPKYKVALLAIEAAIEAIENGNHPSEVLGHSCFSGRE